MMHFVRTFSIMLARRKAYHYRRGSKLQKNCSLFIENIFENGWWEDAYPSSYLPESALGNKLQKLSRVWHISVT